MTNQSADAITQARSQFHQEAMSIADPSARWVRIKECPVYWVSDSGLIFSEYFGRLLKPVSKPGRAPFVNLKHEGEQHTKSVKRLVALAFLPEIEDSSLVIQKDGDLSNSHYSNLELVSRSEALAKQHAEGKRDGVKRKVKAVETGVVYPSMVDCAKAFGTKPQVINDVLNGRMPAYKGNHFVYADNKVSQHHPI